MAPYPLRTAVLAFADDMAIVTATIRQPLQTARDATCLLRVLHNVTDYLVNNMLLVYSIQSTIMVHNAPPPSLRPGDPPMELVRTATYLRI